MLYVKWHFYIHLNVKLRMVTCSCWQFLTLCSTVECDISMYIHTHTHMWRSDFVLYEDISLVLAYKMGGHAPPQIKLWKYTQIKAYWLFYGSGIRNGFNFAFSYLLFLICLSFFFGKGRGVGSVLNIPGWDNCVAESQSQSTGSPAAVTCWGQRCVPLHLAYRSSSQLA